MNLEKTLANLALCLGFFSRIPLPEFLGRRITPDSQLTGAVSLFPVAGLLIGLVPALVWYVGIQFLPALIAAGLAVASGLIVTGALHEDGFADCADGLGATPDRKKALEIMRDSRIGTYGALALPTTVGLRWVALASLAPLAGLLAILIAHSGSRSAITLAMRFSIYARPEGLGQQAEGELAAGSFETGMIIALAIAMFLGWFAGLAALAVGFVLGWLFLKYLDHRLGGFTGDGLGAIQQVAEIAIIITLAGVWS